MRTQTHASSTFPAPPAVRPLRRWRGAVMSEFVLIVPLIVVIIALLFYMGGLMTRTQHLTAMPRYEVWRQVDQAPGPGEDADLGNPLLNQAFFGGHATLIRRPDWSLDSGAFFPEEPYLEFIDAARRTADAGDWADRYVYRPGGGSGGGVGDEPYRLDAGRRRVYEVGHVAAFDAWERAAALRTRDIANPEDNLAIRQHIRIGTDWSYTNDYRASSPTWSDTRGTDIGIGHLRSMRDAFFLSYDEGFDGIDGDNIPEYSDNAGGPQNPDTSTLAGLLRTLWLSPPDYRGPNVP